MKTYKCHALQLMAIEDPVEDSKGFVYEKSYIEQYISKNRGQSMYVKCPEHGMFPIRIVPSM